MVEVASKWFGFELEESNPSSSVRVHVCDGVEFVISNATKQQGYNFFLFDFIYSSLFIFCELSVHLSVYSSITICPSIIIFIH